MDLDDVQKFIAAQGFPAAVCAWLLFERYKNNGALIRLVERIVTLQEEWQHRWLRLPPQKEEPVSEDGRD